MGFRLRLQKADNSIPQQDLVLFKIKVLDRSHVHKKVLAVGLHRVVLVFQIDESA